MPEPERTMATKRGLTMGRQAKPEAFPEAREWADPAAWGESSERLGLAGDVTADAARLGHPWLQGAQRRALAARVGHLQGNHHLQRLLEGRRPGGMAAPHGPVRTLEALSPLPEAGELQRFGAEEHRGLGAEATGGETLDIDLGDGTKLTFGEMVAMGDWFGSPSEIRALAATPAGQAELRWARWAALHSGPEPAVSDTVKTNVRNRYYRLAASNYAHFSAGGTAQSEYARLHEEALGLAFFAGASENPVKWGEARAIEAFAQHYLSDMFAGGHIRTPRMQIKQWYQEVYPDSVERFASYAAERMTAYLDAVGDIPWYWRNVWVTNDLKPRIIAMGGDAVRSYSLGDLVGMAYHNQDNVGLGVVSDVGPDGAEAPGGFRWTAKGDDRLAESPITRQMALGAMGASLNDLELMRQAGLGASGGTCVPDEELQPFLWAALANLHRQPYAAERYVPREDPLAGNTVMCWYWGAIDPVLRGAIDDVVRRTIAGELRGKADAVPEVMRLTRRGREDPDGAVTLHVRDALEAFCDELAAEGIAALEKAIQSPAVAPSDAVLDGGVPLPAGVAEDPADAGVE